MLVNINNTIDIRMHACWIKCWILLTLNFAIVIGILLTIQLHIYSIGILFLLLDAQQMQVNQQVFHVTGRESGTAFQEQIPRLPTVPLSRQDPSWPSRHRLGGAPASSSGSYQSKLEEHMLTGTALCVEPLFSQQQNKAGPWQEA